MSNDPDGMYQKQRHEGMRPRQDVRGTMETVGLEQRERNVSGMKIPSIVINVLAVIGGIAVLYVVADLVF